MIAWDLDGVILIHDGVGKKGTGVVGPVNEEVACVMRQTHRAGYYHILHSAREWSELEIIKNHLELHAVPIDEYWLGIKPPAMLFVDDRAVNPRSKNWKQELQDVLNYGNEEPKALRKLKHAHS